jgi:hypothetical protein
MAIPEAVVQDHLVANGYMVERSALERAGESFADALEMIDEIRRPHQQVAAAATAMNACLGVCAAGGVTAVGDALIAMLDRAGREMMNDVARVRATIRFYEEAEDISSSAVRSVESRLR